MPIVNYSSRQLRKPQSQWPKVVTEHFKKSCLQISLNVTVPWYQQGAIERDNKHY